MSTVISSEDWRFYVSIFVSLLPTIFSSINRKPRVAKNIMFYWILFYISYELSKPLFKTLIPVSFNSYISLFRISSIVNIFGYIIVNWKYKKVIFRFFSKLNRNSISDIDIKKNDYDLDVKQIQDLLGTFAKDATKLYSYAGRANFLIQSNPNFDVDQFEIITSLGRNSKILVSEFNEAFNSLLGHGVQIRLYPSDRIGDNLRGNLKICQINGASACLFSKYISLNKIRYEYLEITNGEVVEILKNDFNTMFNTRKNPHIKNVIFDLAGVAFDGDIQTFYSKIKVIANKGIQNMAHNHGCIDEDLNLGKINICEYVSMKTNRKFNRIEKEEIINAWTSTWTLNPFIKQYIDELKELGYKVSIASNCDNENMNNYELKGWFNVFDQHFLSNKMGIIKPNVEFYNYIIQELNTSPDECLFIDDYKPNIDAAHKLGFRTVLIDRRNDPLKKISQINQIINEK